LRFRAPFGGLGSTYTIRLRLIGKRVVDFLFVLLELFSASCYGIGATSEYRLKIGEFAPTGSVWSKMAAPLPTILLLRELG